MNPATTSIWPIIAIVSGIFASLVGGLVILNLQSLKKCIGDLSAKQALHDEKIDKLMERKNFCNQDFVGKVDYIRSMNGIEESNKTLIKEVAALGGSMEVIKQMPQICGSIAKEFVKEMKHNG